MLSADQEMQLNNKGTKKILLNVFFSHFKSFIPFKLAYSSYACKTEIFPFHSKIPFISVNFLRNHSCLI